MRKFIFIYITIIIGVLLIGCQKKEKGKETEQIKDGVIIEHFVDTKLKTKLKFTLPKDMLEKCDKKIRTNLEEEYCEITIFLKDTNYNLFTIVYCKDESYKEFENEKKYEILSDEKKYKVIWYEYGYVDVNNKELPKELTKFQSEYKRIKSSLYIENLK